MSATVAAALKKIAVALLTDKKTWKRIGFLICMILVLFLMPIIMILAIFSANFDDLDISVDDISLDAETIIMMTNFENDLVEIESAMTDAEQSGRADEAQAVYVLVLYQYRDEEDFIDRIVQCYVDNESEYDVVTALNDEFGCSIEVDLYIQMVNGIRSTEVTTKLFDDPSIKNAHDLSEWAWQAYRNGWGYVWGTYGQILTTSSLDSLAQRIPDHVGRYLSFIQDHWLGRRTADCVGLIKGYLWYNPESCEIEYGYGGFTDYDADSMYYAASISGDMTTMPDVPGIALWTQGHVGIYVGNGMVIHASGTRTGIRCQTLASTSFTNWFEVPGVVYPDLNTAQEGGENGG